MLTCLRRTVQNGSQFDGRAADAELGDPRAQAALANKNLFVNTIASTGQHPRLVSQGLGNMAYEQVANSEFSIRLSREHRLYFEVQEEGECVFITQAGGHR